MIYFIIIIILSVFFMLETFNKDIIEKYFSLCLFVCFAMLVFQDGFRWETGSDWTPYQTYFDSQTITYDLDDDTFDFGYRLFSYIIRTITDNYSVFLIVYALVFYSIFFLFIAKLSSAPFTSILIFYMVTVCYMGMNRQFLAMAIYSMGLMALAKDKKSIFILMIILGAFFHKTILIGLVALFLKKRIPNIAIFTLLVIVSLIAISGIINNLPLGIFALLGEDTSTKMDFYAYNHDDTSVVNSFLSVLKKMIWILPLIIFDKKIKNKPSHYYLFFNLYLFGSLFYILFNGTILQIIVSRAIIYFNIMEIFLVPYVFSLLKANYGKLCVSFLLVCYVCLNVYKGFYAYGEDTDYFIPYKGIFINTDYQRQSI